MALAESVLPVGTVVASPQRTTGGSTDSLPQITQVNYRDADVAIEIQSTTKALLISRLTTTERNALIATHGMIIYNIDTGLFEGFDNNDQWAAIGGGGGSLTPVLVTTNTQMQSNHQYIVDSVGAVNLNLPPLASFGDVIEIVGFGAGLWTVTQVAFDLHQIRFGAITTTAGDTGTLASTTQGDSLRLVAAEGDFWVVSPGSIGNFVLS